MNSAVDGAPEWDPQQLEVIHDDPTSWQLVTAGAGCGKSAVACQRVAHLVDEGVSASKILLISFTRTAVAELRDRIVLYSVAGERARGVKIATIDSQAWSLRVGFEAEELPMKFGDGSYELGIQHAIELFETRDPDLMEFMGALEHLIIDEAQDVVGVRASLILQMLHSLGEHCGVTVLADPVQAIYGFTTDDLETGAASTRLLDVIQEDSPTPFIARELDRIHRIQNERLVEVFEDVRRVAKDERESSDYVERVVSIIRGTCNNDHGTLSYSEVAELLSESSDESMLVLFRRRADVLYASSYCSNAGVEHRLRLSGLPLIVQPWIGWLFVEFEKPSITKAQFEQLWQERFEMAPDIFESVTRDAAWELLHRMAAAKYANAISLSDLRRLVARPRPPVELCLPDVGNHGPILGTVHASKGREADSVVLVLPSKLHGMADDPSAEELYEEGRIYYVGATRARRVLVAASMTSAHVGYLDSGRVFRSRKGKAQLEVGRAGDVDPIAHLTWDDRLEVQKALALAAGKTHQIVARASPEHDFVRRLAMEQEDSDGTTRLIEIGQMSDSFDRDLKKIWSRVDKKKCLRPAMTINHLYCVGVRTIALTDTQQSTVHAPFNRSGFALAPVIKGFPMVYFTKRKTS